jgi:hypothetical protein
MSRFSSALRPGRAIPILALASGTSYALLRPTEVAHADSVRPPKIDAGLRATPTADLVRSWVVYKIWSASALCLDEVVLALRL